MWVLWVWICPCVDIVGVNEPHSNSMCARVLRGESQEESNHYTRGFWQSVSTNAGSWEDKKRRMRERRLRRGGRKDKEGGKSSAQNANPLARTSCHWLPLSIVLAWMKAILWKISFTSLHYSTVSSLSFEILVRYIRLWIGVKKECRAWSDCGIVVVRIQIFSGDTIRPNIILFSFLVWCACN